MNRSLAPLALALLALAAPATAGAATRCVPANAPGCDSSHATINQAITVAANGDTISIAAGTYAEAINTDKRLNFLGAGGGTLESAVGATTIAPVGGIAIMLGSGGSLRRLRAVGSSGFSGSAALYFSPSVNGSYELDVTDFVGIGGNGSDTLFGSGGAGATVTSTDAGKTIDLNVSNSQFKAGNTGGFIPGTGVLLYGEGLTSTVSRTRIVGSNNASAVALMADHTKATIEDSSVTGAVASQLFDGDYVVRRSRIVATPNFDSYGGGITTADLYAGGLPYRLTIEDSLIVSEPGNALIDSYGIRAYAQGGGDPYTVDVRGSTVISRGADPEAAVAIIYTSGSPPPITVDLRNSVARLEGAHETGEADLVAQHGSIVASSSAFASRAWSGSGSVEMPSSGTNLAGDPKLDANFAPAAGSQLIDRGDPAATYPGELDVNATSRSQDGTGDCVAIPDIGAFELASRCPAKPIVTPNAAPKLSKPSLSRKRFTARKPVHKGRKRGAKLNFTLSEAARVKVTFERKSNGRRIKVAGKRRCVKPTKRNATNPRCIRHTTAGTLTTSAKAGPNTLALTGKLGRKTLTPGPYRLTLTATDPTGLRSKPLHLTFKILRP